MQIGPFTLTAQGLRMSRQPTIEEWEELGKVLSSMRKMVDWWLGDMVNFGEAQRGDDIYQAFDEGVSMSLLDRARFTARAFPPGERHHLSFTHHNIVANLDPQIRNSLLRLAASNHWSVEKLREEAREMGAA